ncbi:MAG: hypothetical protein EXR57_03625, partial [Dehalococcoidia bacterium]|nr:hypothetical protein [Dehalococcoidia bacterium]
MVSADEILVRLFSAAEVPLIIRDHNCQIISKNSNAEYYSGDLYPGWTPIAGIHGIPARPRG